MGYYNSFPISFFSRAIQSGYTTRTMAFSTATGIVDTPTLDLLNTMDLSLISTGVDTKMIALYPLVGGASGPTSYNFMNTATHQIGWFNNMTFTSTYVKSGPSSGYGDTGIIPSASMLLNSSHISVYSYNDIGDATGGDIGAVDNSINGRIEMWLHSFGNTYISNSTVAVNPPGGAYVSTIGYFINNRVQSSEFTITHNGTLKTTMATNSASLCPYPISICSVFVNGTERFYASQRQIGFATIGNGLTNQNIIDLSNIVSTFIAGK